MTVAIPSSLARTPKAQSPKRRVWVSERLTAAGGEYRQRALTLSPRDRAAELARAGASYDEVVAVLRSEELASEMPLTNEELEREARTGQAYLRHAIFLHAFEHPNTAEFLAKNTLGYTTTLDRDMSAHIQSLTKLSRAELAEKYAQLAQKLGLEVVSAGSAAQIAHGPVLALPEVPSGPDKG